MERALLGSELVSGLLCGAGFRIDGSDDKRYVEEMDLFPVERLSGQPRDE